jgi:hypothetical protein
LTAVRSIQTGARRTGRLLPRIGQRTLWFDREADKPCMGQGVLPLAGLRAGSPHSRSRVWGETPADHAAAIAQRFLMPSWT